MLKKILFSLLLAILLAPTTQADLVWGVSGDKAYTKQSGTTAFCLNDRTTCAMMAGSSGDVTITGNLTVTGTITAASIDGGFTEGSVIFADSSGYLAEDNASLFFDNTNNRLGIGTTTPDTILQIANDNWFSAKNSAGTGVVNMFKVNTSDEIEVGATLVSGSIEFTEDSGLATAIDMPVSATPASGTDEGYYFKIDGNNIFSVQAEADSAGGVGGELVLFNGGIRQKRTASAVSYNPSALTSDNIIAITNTSVARTCIISTEDVQSGSTTNPRLFVCKDESGLAGTNNITVSLETGNIDGGATKVISGNYDSLSFYVDGTNAFVY